MSPRPLERILYTEDETDIQQVACLALDAVGGYTVRVCSSGQEAVDAAGGFRPDLILLDVMMPGMDGVQTLERLRAVPGIESTPVIFMTARVQASEVAEYKAKGAIDVIAKPFDPMTLAATVRSIWAQRHG